MAMNKIRGAFAVPRKGETFELRAGLVYDTLLRFEKIWPFLRDKELMLTIITGLSMPTNGMWCSAELKTNAMDETQEQRGETDGSTEKSRFRRRSWP